MKKEDKNEVKKKRKLKFHFKVILFLIILIVYAFTIGTKGIYVRDYVVKTKRLSKEFNGFKILHFSDLHYGSTMKKNDVKKLVKKINEEKADVVIFTGDLISSNKNISEEEESFLKEEFAKIDSEYGKYYVLGDEDDNSVISILSIAGFTNLSNNPQEVYIDNTNPILLINDKITSFIPDYKTNAYKIMVIHDPDEFTDYQNYDFQMVLAGHTLNGSLNIYGLKNVFIDSKYTKTYQKIGNTKMFVSPGLGTKNIKARIFNHPTINLYRFVIN